MNRFRKAISVGMSAAMLASLLATVAAPSVFAAAGSASVTGAVSIGPGQTSTAPITLGFTEGTGTGVAVGDYAFPGVGGVACPGSPTVCFSFTLRLFDKNGGDTLTFVGTPSISGQPGSLTGYSGTLSSAGTGTNNQLLISFTNSNTAQAEPFSITGLNISATAAAPAGAMRLRVITTTGPAGTNWATAAAGISAFGNGLLTVSATAGVLTAGTSVGAVTASDPQIQFAVSGTTTINGIAGSNSLLTVTDSTTGNELVTVTGGTNVAATNASPIGAPTTSITTTNLAFSHVTGKTVSQSVVVPGLLASPGTVAAGLNQDVPSGLIAGVTFPGSLLVQPGETNQAAGVTRLVETAAGTLAANTVITFTLDTTGALFSTAPSVYYNDPNAVPTLNVGGAGVNAAGGTLDKKVLCSLSFDRKSCTVTVTAVSASAARLILAGTSILGVTGLPLVGAAPTPLIDLASTVAQGAAIGITVTTSPSVPVIVNSTTGNTIATVSRILVGVGAQPTIYINENDQSTGQITLTEQGAGQLTAGPSSNYFGLCYYIGTTAPAAAETFTRAPFAVVTAGNLLLRSGAASATSVAGTLFTDGNGASCVYWIVWSSSTVASTIEIRGSDATGAVLPSGALNGPRLSVPAGLPPGPVQADVLNGSQANVLAGTTAGFPAFVTTISNAVRAFRNQPVVAAVTQPIVPPGTVDSLLGNITITETQAGQFKFNETITVTVLPLAAPAGSNQVTRFVTGVTSKIPLIATNTATGLIATAATMGGAAAGGGTVSFSFQINQQATGTLGVITISNMHVFTLADAPAGNILVRVTSSVAGVTIDQVVSPGRIGAAIAGTATTRLGVTQVGAFTTSTKVTTAGKYVTYRFDFGVAAAGQNISIWGATKTGNDWSGFSKVTGRIANASGVVYYYIRQNAATWKSYRAQWTGGGAFTPARQARWLP